MRWIFSTTTRFFSATMRRILPVFFRSWRRPLLTITGSFFFSLNFCIYITSGAKEMIFMNFFSRSSLATGPKTRVPTGSLALSMITAALSEKRM